MAKDAVFLNEISGNQAHLHLENIVAIDEDGVRALLAVSTCDFRRNGLTIGDNDIDDAVRNVVLDRSKMVAE